MKKVIFSEAFLVSLIALIVMFSNLLPFLYRVTNIPQGRDFTGAQFYTLDYNVYLGHFKEGAKGVWLVHDKHTSEPHKGFILRREYIIWGWLTGKVLHLPIWAVYQSARIFGGLLLLLIIYKLILEIFPNDKTKRLLAFFLTTLVAGFYKVNIDPQTGKKTIELFLYWFLEIDASQRFATLFHYLLGNVILLSVLILFIKFLKFRISYHVSLITSILLGLSAALIHPATFVTLYLTLALYLLIRLVPEIIKLFLALLMKKKIFSENQKQFLKEILWCLLFVLFTLPIIPLLKSQVSAFPWTEIAKWDRATFNYIDPKEYALAIGPTFFLGLLAVVIFFCEEAGKIFLSGQKQFFWTTKAKEKSLLLLLCFPLATFLLTFKLWPYLLDINRIRFMQVPIFVPFAILSTIAITKTAQLIGYLAKTIHLSKYSFLFRFCTLSFALCTLIYLTYPAYLQGIMRELTMYPKGDGLLYPDKSWMQGMAWLDKNTKPQEVVLAAFHAAGLIPGFSGNTSYFGHPWSTANFAQKDASLTKFLRTAMTEKEAQSFLKNNHVSYIFYGYQEKSYGGDMTKYQDLLLKVYENPQVTIYRVKL